MTLFKIIALIWENRHSRHVAIHLLILLLLPSIVGVLYGIEYNGKPMQLPIVIVNHDTSKTAQSLVQMLADSPNLQVVKYGTENNEVEEALYKGTVAAGIIIPSDFSGNILNGQQTSIMVFYDGALSTMNSQVRSEIASTLGTIKSGYLISIAEGKLGLSPESAKRTVVPFSYNIVMLGNPTSSTTNMMMQGMLLTIVQIGTVGAGAAICENRRYKRFLGKGFICGLIGTASGLATIAVMHYFFDVPYTGSMMTGVLMNLLTSMGMAFLGLLMNKNNQGNAEKAIAGISIISMTQLLSGYTFPLLAMPKIFQYITWFIPNTHFINPIRDVALLGQSFAHEVPQILWLLGFSILMVLFASAKFFSVRKKSSVQQKQLESERTVTA